MQALLGWVSHELDRNSFLPCLHGFWFLLNKQNAPVLKNDVALHLSVATATSYGAHSTSVQGCDDLMNAIVDALDAPIERHTNLIFVRYFTAW